MASKWSNLQIEDVKERRKRRKLEEKKKLEERLEKERREQRKRLMLRLGVVGAFILVAITIAVMIHMRKEEVQMEEQISGELRVRKGTAQLKDSMSTLWRDVESGISLKAGDSVRAIEESAARISFFDRDEFMLRPNSECEILELTHEGAGLTKRFRVVNNDVIFAAGGIGSIKSVLTEFVTVTPVETPSIFKVKVNRDKGEIAVVVRTGSVKVQDNKALQEKTVARGFGVVVDFKAGYISIPDPQAISMVGEAWE